MVRKIPLTIKCQQAPKFIYVQKVGVEECIEYRKLTLTFKSLIFLVITFAFVWFLNLQWFSHTEKCGLNDPN